MPKPKTRKQNRIGMPAPATPTRPHERVDGRPGAENRFDVVFEADERLERACADPVLPEDACRPVFAAHNRHAPEERRDVEPFPLYSIDDLKSALGYENETFMGDPDEMEPPSIDTQLKARLQRIFDQGEAGCWRTAIGPAPESIDGLRALADRAPHFEAFADRMRRSLLAARSMRMPIDVPPTLLVGDPGLGKTWFLTQLAILLGLPFRSYPMSTATLGEGLQGAHASWRNAQEGLVARTLLNESIGNPLIFVDEIDKPARYSFDADPYRPFYVLLEPAGSRRFVDEFLTFPLDASRVIWIMAANGVDPIPRPILDRLTILHVPDMTREGRRQVAASIYAEANRARRSYFEPALRPSVLDRLDRFSPRAMRVVIEDAMTRAAARGSRSLAPGDIHDRPAAPQRRIGFR